LNETLTPVSEGHAQTSTGAALLFARFGPYHCARLKVASRLVRVTALEYVRTDKTYSWDPVSPASGVPFVSVFRDEIEAEVSEGKGVGKLAQALDRLAPQALVLPGWGPRHSLGALDWAAAHRVPVVVMSESQARDERRGLLKEWVKRRILGLCSAGLAGGRPHAEYLAQLGMPQERIFLGYDAVDNGYFEGKAAESREQRAENRTRYGLPEKYFLASARFVEKKNLPRLLEAYARYRQKAEAQKATGPQDCGLWDLVLLGDGPLRAALNSQLSILNLHQHVHMPGFRQYPDLPAYYGLAGAFVHASTTEQWGLVVNEAMASGLPVLVSNRCGCAPDLVQEGVNGFTFDPYSVEELALLMLRVSDPGFPLFAFGDASRRIVADWGPERFAEGLRAAVDCALRVGPRKASRVDRMLLCALLRR